MRNPAYQLAAIAAGLYVATYFLPVAGRGELAVGWIVFPLSLGFPEAWLVWLANPLFLFGLTGVCWKRWDRARTFGLLALGTATVEACIFSEHLRVGYVTWLGSMLMLFLAGWQGLLHERLRLKATSEPQSEHPRHGAPAVVGDPSTAWPG